MPTPRSHRHRLAVLHVALLAACSGQESGPAARRSPGARELSVAPIAILRDDTFPILARPEWISTDRRGRVLVTDFSDRDIKVYDAAGKRVGAIGRPGRGPGEFSVLMSGQAYGDSVIGFDFGSRLSVFSGDGRYVRAASFRPPGVRSVSLARAVDDSLFLLLVYPTAGIGANLLALARPDGEIVSSFFNPFRQLGTDPAVVQHTGIEADAKGGVVFAALVGGDSVYAFDYSGRRLASGPVDPAQPLVTTRRLVAGNGGKPRRPNGTSVFHHNRNVIRIVALDSASAVVHVARYDAVHGVDRLDGGTILLVALRDGKIHHLGRQELPVGLLGRSAAGEPLLLGYADPESATYALARLVVGPPPASRGAATDGGRR